MAHLWTCPSCTTPQPHDTLYGGRCTICCGIICMECLRVFNDTRRSYLSPEYTDYLKTIRPHIIHRALIAICISCVTKTETEFMRTYPYEQLPLLINHMWYGENTDRLYKDRLQGLIP